jgi:hypothetical protein
MTFVVKFNTQSPCITGTSLTQLSLSQIVKRYQLIHITCCEELHVSKQNIQSNLVIRNVLIRNKLVLRNHFLWLIVNLLHKDCVFLINEFINQYKEH